MDKLQAACQANPNLKPYLTEKVFPILTDALEALLKEIEFRQKRVEGGEMIQEIQPLLFLAQYLMRHNPAEAIQ